MKEWLQVSVDDDDSQTTPGLEIIHGELPVKLTPAQITNLTNIVGEENISRDTYTRLRASYGQGLIDNLRLRAGIIENIPDVVIQPRNKQDIEAIVAYCMVQKIPIYVASGHTSVTRGCEAIQGGISLDISTHMNRVIHFNRGNQTITVQPGITGPALEEYLNHRADTDRVGTAYTCGHFPQSFEFSTVGGWVLTRGAGQNSTYYGKIEDLVLSQEYVTPVGTLKTQDFPRQATGPDIDQILIGSEGTFGILVEVTLKVFRYYPKNRRYFSYMFRDWDDAQHAAREIIQSQAGMPSVFRISDPEETDVAMHLYIISGTLADKLLSSLGFQAGKKCLMLGTADGDRRYCSVLNQKIRKICKSHRALNLSAFSVSQRWERERFRDPYLRDSLLDMNVLIDTLECSVTWENLPRVHSSVRRVVKSRPNTICMTHVSHAYPQGANLYFIFITRSGGIGDYLQLQYSILDAIQVSGASISHHHGLGKQLAPWFPDQVGDNHIALLRSLKQHFDPDNIMNPGGTLGLDMTPVQSAKVWGLDNYTTGSVDMELGSS
jgi:alkyldihydroxyacetonephosphate synthase